MKIIKKGLSKTQLEEKEWVGETMICDECGCRFKLESGDKVKEECDSNGLHFNVKCPNCKEKIFF